jgi:ARG/rhodanese/phosphatase superfamily protein
MLESTLQLGEPVAHRGIVLAPLFPRRSPAAEYVTLEDALALGLRIDEVSESGSVPQLAVANPTDANVLLYDGEELLGAKQNRILNVTVLVAANSKTPIPVSCVEEGRWNRSSASFTAAPHAAHPELRRRKAQTLAAEPLGLGLAQSEVWDEVRAKSARLRVDSPTGAEADVFRSRESELRQLERAFPLQPGQCGAVLALGDDLCLDYVSRPDAFARLFPKLRAGYLLDGLERLDGKPAQQERLAEFVSTVETATRARRPSAGLGQDVRLAGIGVVGSGLELEGELLQLCAFTGGGTRHGRVARPSRRR